MRIDNNLIDMFHEYRRHITHTLYNMSVSNMMDENRDIHKMIGYNSNLEYNLRYYSRNPIIYNLYENRIIEKLILKESKTKNNPN